MFIDAHLDLSMNAMMGRDITLPAAQQPARENEIATVGLPDLRAGGVGLICATIFCFPTSEGHAGYSNAEEAHAEALRHFAFYHDLEQRGLLKIVRSRADLENIPTGLNEPTRAILLLEGADAIRGQEDVAKFFDLGLRVVGLAWRRTLHAGGTGNPGPLTPLGKEIVKHLDAARILHDASHLSDESFWDLMAATDRPVMASHSNCRAIVPGDRHLTDEMIGTLAARGGIVGINFFDKFLLPPEEMARRRVTLADVAKHLRHACDVIGDTHHVGIGTDMDGGLGRDQVPAEITTSADFPKLDAAFARADFDPAAIKAIASDNWLRFFRAHLAAGR